MIRKEYEERKEDLENTIPVEEYEDPQTRAYREKYLALLKANTELVEENQNMEKAFQELKQALKVIVKWL